MEDYQFYVALVKEHPNLFKQAKAQQCLICIPPNDSLPENKECAAAFLKTHLLLPSKEFLGLWTTLEGDRQVEQGAGRCLCTTGPGWPAVHRVKVLHEEVHYNGAGKPYKVVFLQSALTSAASTTRVLMHWPTSLPELVDELHRHTTEELRADINRAVRQFQHSYQIFEGYEHLLAAKINGMFVEAMQSVLAHSPRVAENKRSLLHMQLAVHTYLLHGVHDKLFAHFKAVNAPKDQQLQRYRQALKWRTVQSFGAPKGFEASYTTSIMLMSRLSDYTSPYQKMHFMSEVLCVVPVKALGLYCGPPPARGMYWTGTRSRQ